MTRDEQLVFCLKCTNRKMDHKQGYVCKLTGEKAAFENTCKDFVKDESVKERIPDDKETLELSELQEKLSDEVIRKIKSEQKLIAGILAGSIAGIIGAVLWGYITVLTNFQIGYMALAIGAGVGFTIRKFGNGIENIFGFWGAGISLLSVILGNILSIIGFVANEAGLGLFETLLSFDFSYLPALMSETFSLTDILFYGIATYEGYKFSFRVITEKNMQELRSRS